MTKILIRIATALLLLYLAAWGAAAAYVAYLVSDVTRVERALAPLFVDQQLSIEALHTEWRWSSVELSAQNVSVTNAVGESPLSMARLDMAVDPWSFLVLWPHVTALGIEQLALDIDVRDPEQIKVAGLALRKGNRNQRAKRRILRWMLDQSNVALHDGRVIWRRAGGVDQVYDDFNLIYERERESRSIASSVESPKGALSVRFESRGDIVEQSQWDATLEVLGAGDSRLLGEDDFRITVDKGRGLARLEALDVQRISDVLLLAGVGPQVEWYLNANVSGHLRDVEFEFSGPLLDLTDWQFTATALDLGIQPLELDGNLPLVRGLDGTVVANRHEGHLDFNAQDAEFRWDRWFERSFPIDQASGRIQWRTLADGRVRLSLLNGVFKDAAVALSDLTASLEVGQATTEIDSVADLFTVDSIEDLSFDRGVIVSADTLSARPLINEVIYAVIANIDHPIPIPY